MTSQTPPHRQPLSSPGEEIDSGLVETFQGEGEDEAEVCQGEERDDSVVSRGRHSVDISLISRHLSYLYITVSDGDVTFVTSYNVNIIHGTLTQYL